MTAPLPAPLSQPRIPLPLGEASGGSVREPGSRPGSGIRSQVDAVGEGFKPSPTGPPVPPPPSPQPHLRGQGKNEHEIGDLALYIHWPFCLSKCPYCDFNSHVRDAIDTAAWQAAYLNRIRACAARTGPRRVTSLYFGGGTPQPDAAGGPRAPSSTPPPRCGT